VPAPDFTNLVWADEFSEAAGTPIRDDRWMHEVGGHGWGNGELQTFTDRTVNSVHDGGGDLDLIARRERFRGRDGYTRDYTSARIITKGRFAFTYGKVEARIKSPAGTGLWPIFWAMGDDVWDIGWPFCGEFDIMEMVGNDPNTVHGTVHGPRGTDGEQWQNGDSYTAATPLTDDYHVYTVKWWADGIEWLIDGVPYHRILRSQTPSGAEWVFDHPFHLILSLSVGGSWPGAPNAETQFPATMHVDWVRVYQ
jgi:beta-glucanase (GH16 family)